jgi:translation initiation factor 1A
VNILSKNKKGKPQKKGKGRTKKSEHDSSTSFKVIGKDGQEEYIRVRLPRNGEILGIVTRILGADRIEVRCMDGKTRVVRIPGKHRKRLWCRQNDIVTILPWYGLQEDTRADLVWRYNRNQARWLEEKGYVKFEY